MRFHAPHPAPRRPGATAAALASLAAVATLATGCTVRAEQATQPTTASGITAQGTGSAMVTPDQVRLDLLATTLAGTSEAALDAVAVTTERLREVLADADVAEEDVTTQSVSVGPEYDYAQTGQTLKGYRASQYLTVTVRDADGAGALLDALVAAGGDGLQVTGATPTVLDTSAGADAAREAAIASARAKAERYADLLGVDLGDVVYVTEVSSPGVMPIVGVEKAVSSDAAAPQVVIDLGQREVQIVVEVRWEIDQ
jgi:uncharacterized protein YggE